MSDDTNNRIMNKIMLALAVVVMGIAACAQDKGGQNMQTGNKPLVVYFSATGTTAKAARTIAEVRSRVAPCTRLSRNKPIPPMTLTGTTASHAARRK